MASHNQKQVSLNKIYLDPENPRHETLPDQPSIIKHLVSKERVRALAKDIAEAGGTNPIELIALVQHPKVNSGYIVVEGNRRICALKLLQDPDKANIENDKRYFAGLAQGMSRPINKVDAMVFDSRDSAQRWFALRHEGEQGGIGTKAWDSDQKARFSLRTQSKNPNAQAFLILDYARRFQLLSAHEASKLNITTLTRYLSNPVMRHALGLVDGNSLEIEVPDTEFERALTRFLRDALSPVVSGVSSRTSARQRKEYAQKLVSEGVAATTFGGSRHVPRSGNDLPNGPSLNPSQNYEPSLSLDTVHTAPEVSGLLATSTTTPKIRDNLNPDKRTHVIQQSFRVSIKQKRLKRLFDELKNIDALEFSFAATYLVRAVIENGIAEYLKSKSIEPDGKLHEKYKQLAAQLKAEGMTDRELKFLRTIAQNGRDDHFSPDSLGHFIHGGAVPDQNYAMRYWDNVEEIMARVLKGL